MTLQGQDFGGTRSNAAETLRDLIPLSYENRDRIVQEYSTQPATERMREKYNGRKTIQFSAEDSDDEYRQTPGTPALEKLGVKLAGSKGRYELDRFLPVEYNAAVSKQGSRASAAKARM